MPTNRGQKYNSNLIFLSLIFFLVSFGVLAELWRLTYSHQRVLGLMAQIKDDSSVGSGKELQLTPLQEVPTPTTAAVIQPEPTQQISRPPEEVTLPTEPILIPIKDAPSQTINVVDPSVELALRNESQKLSISVVTIPPTEQTSPSTVSPILFPSATPVPQAPGTSSPVTEEPSSSIVVNDPIYGSSSTTVPNDSSSPATQTSTGIAKTASDTLLSFFGINSDNADTTTTRATPKPVEGVALADSSGEIVNNVLNDYKLSVSAAGTESIAIKRGGIAAVTSLPIRLSVNNISFSATTSTGEKPVTFYADSVVDTLITQRFISRVKPAKNSTLISTANTDKLVKLMERNGELVYEIVGESNQYLFLIFPVKVTTTYDVTATNVKQIRLRTQSRLNQIIDILSLEI